MRPNSWQWRFLCFAFSIWLAFAIMRVLKRPGVLLIGLCFALLAVGVAAEAMQQ